MNPQTLRPLVAEFVGTALFVFLAAGSVVANAASNNALGAIGTAVAHGIGLAVAVTMTMSISGGHLNPAISVALWIARKIDARTLGRYVVAQIVGAVVGAFLVKAFFPAGAARVVSMGTPQLSATLGLLDGLLVEALMTFVLASAVFGTAVSAEAPKVGGLGIGLAVLVCGLTGGALTGAALNPARAFGPALVAGEWYAHIPVYWVGPLLGAAAAAALWRFVLLPRDATRIA